jgi:ABC-type nitrate/sulfonate/bicarbonate transport system substrate-binding protein
MSMGDDRTLSAEHQAKLASALVDAASAHQEKVENLLNALDRGTTDMPNKIAHEVVQRIADLVTQKVADVLQPAEAKAQTLLSQMEKAVEEYRRAAAECQRAAAGCRREARSAVLTCVIAAAVSAVLAVFNIMKIAGVF